MTPEQLSAIAGVVLSLIFSYVPAVSDWYAKLDGVQKRMLMLVLIVVVALSSFLLTCSKLAIDLGLAITCDRAGVMGLVGAVISALIANQGTYLLSPQKNREPVDPDYFPG